MIVKDSKRWYEWWLKIVKDDMKDVITDCMNDD